jgi:hypothetical protein
VESPTNPEEFGSCSNSSAALAALATTFLISGFEAKAVMMIEIIGDMIARAVESRMVVDGRR